MEQDVDEAIEIAAERTREAEQALLEQPRDAPDLEDRALRVEHRAEDLHELTADALEAADPASPAVGDDPRENGPGLSA